jgi:hypothetical protein
MLPIIFEWAWDIGHYIFFGLFYLALATILSGLMYVFIKTLVDLSKPSPH